MPFAVFRRHQRKLLAIFAILAMFGFVLADSLPRLLSGGYVGGNGDPSWSTLYGKSIHAERPQRDGRRAEPRQPVPGRALGAALRRRRAPGLRRRHITRALVDALILQHEADALKMPDGPEVGQRVAQAGDRRQDDHATSSR